MICIYFASQSQIFYTLDFTGRSRRHSLRLTLVRNSEINERGTNIKVITCIVEPHKNVSCVLPV